MLLTDLQCKNRNFKQNQPILTLFSKLTRRVTCSFFKKNNLNPIFDNVILKNESNSLIIRNCP